MTTTLSYDTPSKTHLEAFAKITATKQGALKGDSKRDKMEQYIQVLGIEFGAKSPRDANTGQSAGRRQYEPFEIEIELGPPAAQLMQALANNEVLTKAEFSIYKQNEAGAKEVATKITLEKATVSGYKMVAGEDELLFPHVRFAFTFSKIEIDADKTMMMDNWMAQ
jgi:type VI secretion system Hcp family effector